MLMTGAFTDGVPAWSPCREVDGRGIEEARRGSSLLVRPLGQHARWIAAAVALLQWSRQPHEEDCIPRKRPRNGRRNGENGRGSNGSRPARRTTHITTPAQERAYLVGLDYGQRATMGPRESLRELGRLARTAGATVVGQTLQRRKKPEPATYIGAGKVDEIHGLRAETGYSVVIFDEQLSPGQQLRLESALEVKVLDRSALILDIFASRASTREAALQVELAQHEYLLPRLRGQWQHLERLEGAIGSRGPGETQLETDRRLIGQRIQRLKQELEKVRRHRAQYRARRHRNRQPVVALVGYTNAGKSSLLNALSNAGVLARGQLFSTLDPVTRKVRLPDGGEALLTDTVGFIQKLPTALVAAFRATLEEVQEASVLLHVVDISHPNAAEQVEVVEDILRDLKLTETPRVLALNKVDLLDSDSGAGFVPSADGIKAVLTSAVTGAGLHELLQAVSAQVADDVPSGAEPALTGAKERRGATYRNHGRR